MNVVVLVGRLAQDPVMRTTSNGHSVCTFSLAVDRRFSSQDQQTADFINIVAWNRQAELICQYLGKGRQIAIQGRLQTRSYQAKDGTKRYVTEVVLENFDFIGSRNDSGNFNQQNQNYGYNQNPRPNNAQNQQDDRLEIDDDFSLLSDDDEVPF